MKDSIAVTVYGRGRMGCREDLVLRLGRGARGMEAKERDQLDGGIAIGNAEQRQPEYR
jgi:hypothetical protein